ncbi:MAG: hypothetical protein WC835_02630 [Candidatus Paceibacterota bacterium]|jgi:hypothetical protein
MSIKIVGGVAVITFDNPSVFLGSSAKGEYPPTGIGYSTFSFRPDEGEDGILAFSTKYPAGHTTHNFFQLRPEGGKVFLDRGIQTFDHTYLESPDFILGVQDGEWTYVVKMPKNATTGKYKVVGIVPLLEYIEGFRSLRGLNQNARRIEIKRRVEENCARLAKLHKDEMYEMRKNLQSTEKARRAIEGEKQDLELHVALLREENRHRGDKIEQLGKANFGLALKHKKGADLIYSLGWLLSFYRRLPAWARPRFIRKTLRLKDELGEINKMPAPFSIGMEPNA